jgi:4-amino-4-deoxy-L-arabinose transferase-like glycosyltransferase
MPDCFVIAIAVIIFFGCMISPPGLMDDVDASHGQLARNMLTTGDWVIPQLDGVAYMEKAPLPYWMIAVSYMIFGVHDWAARLPFALGAVVLCWVTFRYGRWAFSGPAGLYAGMALATSVGLFLFTRILIPDVLLTVCITLCFWSFQRAMNDDGRELHSRRWAALMAASMAVGVMLKGLIALVIPIGGLILYLLFTRQFFLRETWRRLRPLSGLFIFIVIAAPWHVMASLRMPPYLDLTMRSVPGQYHGFFWFYFMNEHVLRFLGLRYPHDYNTVPRLTFWLLNLLWLFPWSFYLVGAGGFSYRAIDGAGDRASRTRLLAVCWAGFLLIFFTFSTTQEYYSMPIYPALALLLSSAMAIDNRWTRLATKAIALVASVGASIAMVILYAVRNVPITGDISSALEQHPGAYTLSLGHMGDLTLRSFAYLRMPLTLACVALLIGAAGCWVWSGRRAFFAILVMMMLFFHASRIALRVFDPYLSSRPLAQALLQAPKGQLIVDGAYYSFSSVFFYADRTALLLNGRSDNLEYGSYAPGAPRIFINEDIFLALWRGGSRYYLLADAKQLEHLRALAGPGALYQVAAAGGKFLLSNQPVRAADDGVRLQGVQLQTFQLQGSIHGLW